MRKLTTPVPQVVSLVAAALLYFLALTGCAQPRASTWTPDGASENAARAGLLSLGAWEPLGLSGGGGNRNEDDCRRLGRVLGHG